MKISRILELVKAVPPHVTLYDPGLYGAPYEAIHRRKICAIAYAQASPCFPWDYAVAFAVAKQPLPSVVTEPAIRQAYEFLTTNACHDSLRDALVLREPPMSLQRGLLEALFLVDPALPLERICELACLPAETIKIYGSLFFDLSDRRDDAMFICGLVYPDTRQVEFQADYLDTVDPSDLLKRAAYRGGLQVVLELAGALASGNKPTRKELIRILQTDIMAEAAWLAKAGLVHQPLPIFDLASKIIVADIKATALAAVAANAAWQPLAGTTTGLSVLEAAKAAVINAKSPTRPQKVPLKAIWISPSQSSHSSHGSHSSHRPHERQTSITGSESQTARWLWPTDGMRTADTVALSDRQGHALVENSLGQADCAVRETESSIVVD